MTATVVDNLFLVQNGNGTVDTMRCRDLRMVKWLANATQSPRGGVTDLTRLSVLERLELESTELKFQYRTSQN